MAMGDTYQILSCCVSKTSVRKNLQCHDAQETGEVENTKFDKTI